MSLALGIISYVTSGGFLTGVMWRDRIEIKRKNELDRHTHFVELKRKREKRLQAQAIKYRPIAGRP